MSPQRKELPTVVSNSGLRILRSLSKDDGDNDDYENATKQNNSSNEVKQNLRSLSKDDGYDDGYENATKQ